MPESSHRRKGKKRARPTREAPPPVNPTPSPDWVPLLGVGLLVLGLLVILAGYLFLKDITGTWPLLGPNWGLALGFVALLGGFWTLTKWQ